MLICKVVGHVWATKKEDSLNGLKLMVVQEYDNGRKRLALCGGGYCRCGHRRTGAYSQRQYGTKGFRQG